MKLSWIYGKHKCVSKNGKLYINFRLRKWNIALIILINLSRILRRKLFK